MATRYKTEYESEIAFMEEILKHDPCLQNISQDVMEMRRQDAASGNTNIAMLFEDLVARVGGFRRNPNMTGDDYLHGQGDAKTLTLGYSQTRTQKQLIAGAPEYIVCSASLRGLENKQGPLRIMAYITATKSIEYYFLPTIVWKPWVNKSGIVVKYQPTTNTLGRMNDYKTDFLGICRTEIITPAQLVAKTPQEEQDILFNDLFA